MSATINLKLWKYRAKKDGSFPIYIRITKNRKSTWQSTDIAIKAKDWDLSINRYKEVVYAQVDHATPATIIAEIEQLDAERMDALRLLKGLLA